MKERLREIAEQAGRGQERWNTTAQFESFLENFAQLIVRQCANMVRESSLPDAYSEPCLQVIADDIMEHFGVEE